MMPVPLTSEAFQAETGATADAVQRLSAYLDLLKDWQGRINLVGASTLEDPWRRHMLDSAQLLSLIEAGDKNEGEGAVIDVGSGAGFPGLVLATLGLDQAKPQGVHLVESDGRKCAFLREAIRVLGVRATVHQERVEAMSEPLARVLTARAWAPLERILSLGFHLIAPGGTLLLLKGERAEQELTTALKRWKMRVERIPSRSDPRGRVLKIKDIIPKNGRDG